MGGFSLDPLLTLVVQRRQTMPLLITSIVRLHVRSFATLIHVGLIVSH
jgi:hypothetical protein